jgi:hypothetical protein
MRLGLLRGESEESHPTEFILQRRQVEVIEVCRRNERLGPKAQPNPGSRHPL